MTNKSVIDVNTSLVAMTAEFIFLDEDYEGFKDGRKEGRMRKLEDIS
jgi:hypothetical protein